MLQHGAHVARPDELSQEMIVDEENFDSALRAALGADIHLVIDLN